MVFGSRNNRTSEEELRGRSREPVPLMESKVSFISYAPRTLNPGLDYHANKPSLATYQLVRKRILYLNQVHGFFQNQSLPLLVQACTTTSPGQRPHLLWQTLEPVSLWRSIPGRSCSSHVWQGLKHDRA